MANKANKMRNKQITANTTVPPAARRSHWQARVNDLIDFFGNKKRLVNAAAKAETETDAIKLYNQITAIQRQRMAVESAAKLVTGLEKLKPSKS